MTIETNNFVATPKDIEDLASGILDNVQQAIAGRGTYLKALIATTQSSLGISPRKRNTRAEQLSGDQTRVQLAAFEEVFKSFHEVVVKVAESAKPIPDTTMLRQRTGFSRSAGSTLRGYIRAGHDLRSVAAATATKAALAVPRTKRSLTVKGMTQRVERLVSELEKVARNLQAANRESAQAALRPVLAMLVAVTGASEHSTKDANEAMEQGLPFATRTDVFIPIDLASIRAARRAA